MAKEIINVEGEDVMVREDTAKSYRGVMWFLGTVLIFIVIALVMYFGFFAVAVSDGELDTPKTKTGETVN
jgi:hypothetical protein